MPLSITPSISKEARRFLMVSSNSSDARSSTYRRCIRVLERTPLYTSTIFRRVSRRRLRIRAELVFTESENPSFEPRSTFSRSAWVTPILGYPLLDILMAWLKPSMKKMALPASMALIAASMVGSSETSEMPRELYSRNSFI